jgi:hypothetical protein
MTVELMEIFVHPAVPLWHRSKYDSLPAIFFAGVNDK